MSLLTESDCKWLTFNHLYFKQTIFDDMSGNEITSKLIGPTDGLSLHGRGLET